MDRIGANFEDERVSLASTRKKQATPQGMASVHTIQNDTDTMQAVYH